MSMKPCEDCNRPSNNKFYNCPPRMDDGRHFTDYRPRCTAAFQDKVSNTMMSSHEYRVFLINNASELIKKNATEAYVRNRCGPCVEPYDQGTMLPEFEKQVCNERTCSFGTNNPYGIGLGRQFYTTEREGEFRKKFLEEKQIEQQFFKESTPCCGTVQDDMQYYPIDGVVPDNLNRVALPGGGTPLSGGDRMNV